MIELQRSVRAVIDVNDNDESDLEFWINLNKLRDFLLPFKLATDLIQSDSATVLDIYYQFGRVLKHCKDFQGEDAEMRAVGDAGLRAVRKHWHKYTNSQALIVAGWVGF